MKCRLFDIPWFLHNPKSEKDIPGYVINIPHFSKEEIVVWKAQLSASNSISSGKQGEAGTGTGATGLDR